MSFEMLPSLIAMIIKIMVLVALSLYIVFAGIMVRQEQQMDKVIDETFEPVLRVLVIVHLAGAIGLFIFAFISL